MNPTSKNEELSTLLTSGIPDPHAYGANVFTSIAANPPNATDHNVYMIKETILPPNVFNVVLKRFGHSNH